MDSPQPNPSAPTEDLAQSPAFEDAVKELLESGFGELHDADIAPRQSAGRHDQNFAFGWYGPAGSDTIRPMTYDVATLQAVLDPLLPGLLGVKLLSADADRVVAQMRVRADLCTTGGMLHGGAYMAFADTLGAVGSFMTLAEGARTTTTDSSTKFIAGAKLHSTIVAECVALHRGRTTQVWQTTIRREDGKLCAVVTQTQLAIPA